MLSKNIRILLLTICMIFAASACYAAGETVRVGYVPTMNYSEKAADGSLTGYEAEYLHAVAQHTDWKYEFVEVSSVEEGLELLRKDVIDIMGGVKPSSGRRREFFFSKNSCVLDKSALIVIDTDPRYGYEAYHTFSGMRVGYVARERERAADLEAFSKKKGFPVTMKDYPDGDTLFHALHTGEIDAVLVSALYNLSTDYRVVLRSNFIPVYFAVNSKDRDIAEELDEAVENILKSDPYFNINLYTKHYSSDAVKPEFTEEEKDFIKKGREIVVVYDPDFYPIEFLDRETGEFRGYAAKVFQKISEKSGLKFVYKAAPELQEDPYFLMADRKYDICSTFSYDYAWAERHFVRITRPYISKVPAILISRKDQGDYKGPKKIALIKNYFYPGKIRERFPDFEPVYYKTSEECLDSVLRGDTDYAGASLYDADFHFTKDKKYSSLMYRNIPDLFYEYGIGVSRNTEKPLFSIISKSLNAFTEEDNKEIFLTHWDTRSENGWYYIKRNSEAFTVFLLFAISIIAIFIMIDGLFIHRKAIQDLIRSKKK